ncbi:MAG TPA: glycosyltransferase, partial [Bacillota bacterium]|nr:glycosyltransferase [Bacillota bacterium]
TLLAEDIKLCHNQEVKGLSGSRNYGKRWAKGEVITFFDDDAIAAADWLEELIKPYADDNVVAVGGLVLPQADSLPGWFPEEFLWVLGCTYKGHPKELAPVRNVFGGNCSFRRTCMDQAGDFLPFIGRKGDIQLTGEETEYCMRVHQLMPHKQILFNPAARIYHKITAERLSPGYFIKRTFSTGYSSAVIHQLVPKYGLGTEQHFLRHILCSFLPKTVAKLPRLGAAAQLCAVTMGILSTGLGYVVGRCSKVPKGMSLHEAN